MNKEITFYADIADDLCDIKKYNYLLKKNKFFYYYLLYKLKIIIFFTNFKINVNLVNKHKLFKLILIIIKYLIFK